MTRKPTHFDVTVSGGFGFPIDMLRYDRAYPATEADSSVIHNSIVNHGGKDRPTVKLVMPNFPTEGRWNSFGWRVDNYEPRS